MKQYTQEELAKLNNDIDTAMFQAAEDVARKHKPLQGIWQSGEYTNNQKVDIAMCFAAILADKNYKK